MAKIEIFPICAMLSSSSTQDAFKTLLFNKEDQCHIIIIMPTRSPYLKWWNIRQRSQASEGESVVSNRGGILEYNRAL